jgi:hypothetical protein
MEQEIAEITESLRNSSRYPYTFAADLIIKMGDATSREKASKMIADKDHAKRLADAHIKILASQQWAESVKARILGWFNI